MYLKMYMRIWILSHRRILMKYLCSSSYAVIHVWAIKLSCTWCYAFETIIAESRNLDLAQLNRYYRIIDRWAVFTGACPPVLHRSEGTRWGSTTRLQPKRENYYVSINTLCKSLNTTTYFGLGERACRRRKLHIFTMQTSATITMARWVIIFLGVHALALLSTR